MARPALDPEERKRRDAATQKRWREANREKKRKLNRDYVARNRKAVGERSASWRAANPEKVRAAVARQKAKPVKQWEILLRDGTKQYALGRSPGIATATVRQWLSADEIVAVTEYKPEPMR